MRTCKRISQVALLTVVLALAGPMMTAEAQGSGTKHRPSNRIIEKVTLEGELQSSGTAGASAKSASYSFKIAKARDAQGRDLNNLRGQVLQLSQKGKTEELLKRHQVGDNLVIYGTVHLDQRKLEVVSFARMASSKASAREGGGSGSKE